MRDLTPLVVRAAFATVALTFVLSWAVSFWRVANDRRVDVDLGVATTELTASDQLLWSFFGAVIPTVWVSGLSIVGVVIFCITQQIKRRRKSACPARKHGRQGAG